ncbi:hypothetical protein C1Y35_17680 [Pseudomonas sp. GW456-L14]|uniref:hypothetical protein n=1 Tax=unclassified Pseudomonas TaxID=196821 RepID=UPI000C884705|nr:MULTISPECIES: hypothetical protein [unclassified Pseudomonas]PMY38297.1 hypothetical protein C1Y35_17680 [Pseudomonas sp. GW456-L14]PMY52779.1 hypothetical protein C1Y34_21395 [Pseudomonas sp. GW456-L12]
MDHREITLGKDGLLRSVEIAYDMENPSIQINLENSEHVFYGDNLFSCFIKLRQNFPEIKFFCKGAKKNVYPSRASSQMSAGLMAYELQQGKQALRVNIVNIFDYEDQNLTNDPSVQLDFFKSWMASLK